ncbi:MAG TPA: UDP-2,3-diacylglucosamine diphosphatase [Bacteroidales bacterium]|nr:UDP-2,3-diacylglucosamine diphosphatase [Bacteroidales bacterium]
MELQSGRKIFFVSDSHLGIPGYSESLAREKKLVKWLDTIKSEAGVIYLLGDIFEFWFEYRTVVPRGFVRLLGKLTEITDSGIPVYFFTGNHDIWTFGYLEQEIGLKILRDPVEITCRGKSFLIGHGDGLGPGDASYKLAKRAYNNRFLQKIFSYLHPGLGSVLVTFFSKKDRYSNHAGYLNNPNIKDEKLVAFCNQMLLTKHFDFFVFGHRHLPYDYSLNGSSRYINTGEWVNRFTYAVFDGQDMHLKTFTD